MWKTVSYKVKHTFNIWPRNLRYKYGSILKEISPGCSLEGLILMLKLQYFGHLIGWTDSLEKTLMLSKVEDKRRSGWHRMRWKDGISDSVEMNLSKLCEMVKESKVWRAAVRGVAKSRTQLWDWTTTITELFFPLIVTFLLTYWRSPSKYHIITYHISQYQHTNFKANGWMMPAHLGEENLLCFAYKFKY